MSRVLVISWLRRRAAAAAPAQNALKGCERHSLALAMVWSADEHGLARGERGQIAGMRETSHSGASTPRNASGARAGSGPAKDASHGEGEGHTT